MEQNHLFRHLVFRNSMNQPNQTCHVIVIGHVIMTRFDQILIKVIKFPIFKNHTLRHSRDRSLFIFIYLHRLDLIAHWTRQTMPYCVNSNRNQKSFNSRLPLLSNRTNRICTRLVPHPYSSRSHSKTVQVPTV